MRYPTNMTIAGLDVPVKTQNAPVYTVYVCPSCKDPNTGDPLQLYLNTTTGQSCPCCGITAIQPTGQHVYGTYNILDNKITICTSSEQIGGLNLVHETIEGINDICDLNMDHTQISTLGAMLYKAFASGKVDFTPVNELPIAA